MIPAGALVAALAALGAALWIARPLARRERPADAEAPRLARARELHSQRSMLLAALKDLEEDRALGKLAEADFADLQARLSGQAVAVLRQLDVLEQEHERARQAEHPLLPYRGPRRPDDAR